MTSRSHGSACVLSVDGRLLREQLGPSEFGRRSGGFDGDLEAVGLTFNEIDLVAVELADPDDSVSVVDVTVVEDDVL